MEVEEVISLDQLLLLDDGTGATEEEAGEEAGEANDAKDAGGLSRALNRVEQIFSTVWPQSLREKVEHHSSSLLYRYRVHVICMELELP